MKSTSAIRNTYRIKAIVLHKYQKTSANYHIAQKIVESLRHNGVEVICGYSVEGSIDDWKSHDDQMADKGDCFLMHSPRTYHFLSDSNIISWDNRTRLSKLLYLFSHPRFFLSYLYFLDDMYLGFRYCKKRIEKMCLDDGISFILGISNPFFIEKHLASLNVDAPVYILRLDPYAFNPCFEASGFRKRIIEEQFVLSNIDMLFTTELIIQDLISNKDTERFEDKFCSIEFPMISKEDPAFLDTTMNIVLNKDANGIYFLHAGSFYDDIRNPRKLVEFLKKLPQEYKLCVAGTNSYDIRKYDEEIRDRVIDLGCLTPDKVSIAIQECDFLLSYNNLNANMIPSKLFECINSGKPFINLCQSESCPTIKYVDGYEMAYTVVLDNFVLDELLGFLKKTRGCRASRESILRRYGNCTPEFLVNQILRVLRERGDSSE